MAPLTWWGCWVSGFGSRWACVRRDSYMTQRPLSVWYKYTSACSVGPFLLSAAAFKSKLHGSFISTGSHGRYGTFGKLLCEVCKVPRDLLKTSIIATCLTCCVESKYCVLWDYFSWTLVYFFNRLIWTLYKLYVVVVSEYCLNLS